MHLSVPYVFCANQKAKRTKSAVPNGVFRGGGGGAQGAKAPPSDTKMNIIKMKLAQIVSIHS